jgi:hypothetical protein
MREQICIALQCWTGLMMLITLAVSIYDMLKGNEHDDSV